VELGGLGAEEVSVELYYGPMTNTGEIGSPSATVMRPDGKPQDGVQRFSAEIRLGFAGRQGLAVRILPRHDELVQRLVPGYVVWA